jgi:hypothetical protein
VGNRELTPIKNDVILLSLVNKHRSLRTNEACVFLCNLVKLESSNLMSVREMKCAAEELNNLTSGGEPDINNNSTFIFKSISGSQQELNKNSMESQQQLEGQSKFLASCHLPDDVGIDLSNQPSVSSSNDSISPLSNSFTQCVTTGNYILDPFFSELDFKPIGIIKT